MSFAPHVWDQLRSITADELIRALERDDWIKDEAEGSSQIYLKNGRRVSVHFHPGKTFGPKLLKRLLADTGWVVSDLRRLKLVR